MLSCFSFFNIDRHDILFQVDFELGLLRGCCPLVGALDELFGGLQYFYDRADALICLLLLLLQFGFSNGATIDRRN